MDGTLYTFQIRQRRDLLLLRRRARQIASLLGFEQLDATTIAAGTFALGCRLYSSKEPIGICFQIQQGILQILPQLSDESVCSLKSAFMPEVSQLKKRLPSQVAPSLSMEDTSWAIHRLADLENDSVWSEIERVNQELLGTIMEIRGLLKKKSKSPTTTQDFAA